MIELTPADVSVILRHAGTQSLDYLPVAELNDEGQTEIVRWIEFVGRSDDQLSPYAWFSLAEEAAATHDPDEPIVIEMLDTYTLSGEPETLELCRMTHFDWTIDAVPVEFIQNAEDFLDAGVPVRFLLLAEAAGEAFAKRAVEAYAELASHQPQLMASAINAFFLYLCANAGITLDDPPLPSAEKELEFPGLDQTRFRTAIDQGVTAAREIIQLLDPDLSASLPSSEALFAFKG
jgi:hypothetical protein